MGRCKVDTDVQAHVDAVADAGPVPAAQIESQLRAVLADSTTVANFTQGGVKWNSQVRPAWITVDVRLINRVRLFCRHMRQRLL